MSQHVLIVGAGIAGLTLALCLARRKTAVTLIERARHLEEVGAGLQLSPNALRVLEPLGLLPSLTSTGVAATGVTLTSGVSGRVIARVPVTGADGTPYLSLHRADLQAALLETVRAKRGIELLTGTPLEAIEPTGSGVAAHIAVGGRSERRAADLIVGADGVHSTVAKVAGAPPALRTGMTAWRGSFALSAAEAHLASSGVRAWLGGRCHAVAYPISGGRAVNLVMIAPDAAEGANPADLPQVFSTWHSSLRALIGRIETPTPWPLLTTSPERPYRGFDDRVALIGDAAHAMLPYAAQGAGMAIEDAAVLAALIAEDGATPAALRRYETLRRPRIDRVRKRVGFHRFTYHLPRPFSLGRDAVLAFAPPRRLRDGLGWLYDWTPPAF